MYDFSTTRFVFQSSLPNHHNNSTSTTQTDIIMSKKIQIHKEQRTHIKVHREIKDDTSSKKKLTARRNQAKNEDIIYRMGS